VIETPLPSPPVGRRPRGAGRAHRVLGRRDISRSTYVLRFTREDLGFVPGQWINVGPAGRREQREYSIYSSPGDNFLEILVKEIPDGSVSPALRRCRPGDRVEVEGPHGAFTLVEGTREAPRFLFCATGTGVSPFHCFARGVPGLEYRLLHGIGTREDFRETDAFASERYVPCVSRGAAGEGAFPGRLTALLKKEPVDPSAYCYLCGNSDMIYEVYGILKDHGVPREHIFAEVYF
jgi:ferredoxin--NADP+ reductase/benzoate/toluate 1,2-dioxygenase reductase subunit